jgi:lipoic acid synthetase
MRTGHGSESRAAGKAVGRVGAIGYNARMERASQPGRKPPWLKVKMPGGDGFMRVRRIVQDHDLHTVCTSASCPNIGECWSAGVATMMILGGVCTRDCRFCDVPSGAPGAVDADEPARAAEAAALMNLRHVVITSVNRDDLPDGGAAIWAETVRAIRRRCPQTAIEVLPGDFGGDWGAADLLIDARPDVFGHNVETVPSLYPKARPQADYRRSLALLARAGEAGLTAKSGLMLGLGESPEQVLAVLEDLRGAGVSIVAIGQYLRPSREHLPVARYVEPGEFDALAERARAMGFAAVAAGPLVRSSYHAEQAAAEARANADRR